eukprot:CAMPEP_0196160544 /NCGR_PEP_ID=MMETSP0910-20130528/46882_1 /TAXON_ID=49265 /ORGANISM="Thalassiosira rotula, Strain GSO102" /LENGTH=337 /DNA_ID=CAMNT_0041425481 /DNA_START=62 /DNA_END=1076 /DNA_ORIENTATION=+
MKLASLLALLALNGSTVDAFQPASKAPLRQNAKNKVIASLDSRPSKGAPLTEVGMVAINPFLNAFGTSKSPEAKIDYVVDRDYTVALTLIAVGMWLTLFHPSKSNVMNACYLLSWFYFYFGELLILSSLTSLIIARFLIFPIFASNFLTSGDSTFIDMLGGGFHLWFGSFIGYQTMKTRVVCDSTFIDMLGGGFHLWFGSFIGYQTMKTRVVFNKDTFELKTVTNKVLGLQRDKGLKPKEYTNYVLGTNNEWRYDTFVNWDFFPSIQLPILVYFKETQTPKHMQTKGSLGPHQMDRRDNGQMHWFPAFANVRQIREQFEAHGCTKVGPVHGEEFKRQ